MLVTFYIASTREEVNHSKYGIYLEVCFRWLKD